MSYNTAEAIFWSLCEKYGVQISNIFIGVVLARLLMPSDFGLMGIISVFFAISLVFITSGFGAAYVQKKRVTEDDASSIFLFNLIISVLLYFILYFAAPFISHFYNEIILVELIRVSSLVLIFNSLGLIQISKLTREVDFKAKTIVQIFSVVISGVIGIIMANNGYGVWSLVYQQLTKAILNSIGLWVIFPWKPKFTIKASSLSEMLSFSIWVLLSNLVSTGFNNVYSLVIGKLFPMADLGFYSRAKNYSSLVSQQPAQAIGSVSFPILSKSQSNVVSMKTITKKFLINILFFLCPIIALFILIGEPFFILLLTEKWAGMIEYFKVLLALGLLYPFHSLNIQVLNALGKSKLNFKISLAKNTIRVLLIFLTYRYGIIYIIYGEILASVISLIINAHFTNREIGYGIRSQLKDTIFPMSFVILSTVIGQWILLFIDSLELKIVIAVFFVGIMYFMFFYILDRRFLFENIRMIRSKFNVFKKF